VKLGEGFAGTGANAAHVNTMLGARNGPVGHAWATALATPRQGHIPFVVVLRPNVPVTPMTLFVNKATIADDHHATLTWGAAQAGVAEGVVDAVRKGIIAEEELETLVLVAAVWVNPAADDENAVFTNNATATLLALSSEPSVSAMLDAGEAQNPYFRS
jgi:5,6,7,8-tetrahydromethanopterin hydro-lyase